MQNQQMLGLVGLEHELLNDTMSHTTAIVQIVLQKVGHLVCVELMPPIGHRLHLMLRFQPPTASFTSKTGSIRI
jgi:hypothetical protein